MAQWLEVIPSYGRDYKTQKEVKEAWNANKDFYDPASGHYLNKSDTENVITGLTDAHIMVRYSNSRKLVTVK